MKRRWLAMVGIAAALGLLAWAWWSHHAAGPKAAVPTPWFADVTAQVGLDFRHDAGPPGDYFMPQQVGSGAAFFDFDNDGRLDIYLLQNGGPQSKATNRLYRQREEGTFQDVSQGSGLDINGHNMGVAIGDVDNDGWPDVLVTQYNGVKLFRNQGNGTFLDITEASGLRNPSWGTSAAFFDFDRDGWLDLVLVCYVNYDRTWPCTSSTGKRDYCAPKTFKGRVSRLFHNQTGKKPPQREVVFADVTWQSGLGQLPGPGLGVLCADFDGDGWPDIFIANDGEPNRLWINRRNGTFVEEGVLRGIAYNGMAQTQAGMGIAFGDIDGDGLLDVFVTHLTEETHTLWRQGPRGLFQDRTGDTNLLKAAWRGTGFGTLFGDFDQDGHLDLALVNGRVSAAGQPVAGSLGPFWSWYGERNQLFANDGQGRWQDLSASNGPFCGHYNVGRGLAKGDFDGDGALDLLVTSIDGPARLYRNVAAPRGHWLEVRALTSTPHLGKKGWRDALGTEIRIRAGDRSWVQWLHPAESFLCSSAPTAHFGLGSVTKVDAIEALWPDGTREAFPGGTVDRRIELRQGQGRPLPP